MGNGTATYSKCSHVTNLVSIYLQCELFHQIKCFTLSPLVKMKMTVILAAVLGVIFVAQTEAAQQTVSEVVSHFLSYMNAHVESLN